MLTRSSGCRVAMYSMINLLNLKHLWAKLNEVDVTINYYDQLLLHCCKFGRAKSSSHICQHQKISSNTSQSYETKNKVKNWSQIQHHTSHQMISCWQSQLLKIKCDSQLSLGSMNKTLEHANEMSQNWSEHIRTPLKSPLKN